MKKYLAVYIGSVSPEEKESASIAEDIQRKGIQAWGDWANEYTDSIVDSGAPLGKTKRVSSAGIDDHVNSLTGYVIVEAQSLEKAAEMFKSHPHFSVFPGDSVEIIECMEIPAVQ